MLFRSQEVVPKYKQLGNILLQSRCGARVEGIEKNHSNNTSDVVYDIFQTWLREDADASWSVLVQHLRAVDLNSLAQELESCLL